MSWVSLCGSATGGAVHGSPTNLAEQARALEPPRLAPVHRNLHRHSEGVVWPGASAAVPTIFRS